MKVYLDKQSFSYPLFFFFVFENVDHAEIAVIMMIGVFSPDSGESQTAYIHDFRVSILLMWISNFHSKNVGPKIYLGHPSSCQNMPHRL